MVADALRVHPPAISFIRTLETAEAARWDSLVADFVRQTRSSGADTISWKLTSSKKFTVKSLYDKLTEGTTLDIARGL